MSTSVNPCYAVIWLDKDQRTSTYCMRDRGHTGKHNIVNEEPKVIVESVKDK